MNDKHLRNLLPSFSSVCLEVFFYFILYFLLLKKKQKKTKKKVKHSDGVIKIMLKSVIKSMGFPTEKVKTQKMFTHSTNKKK